VVSNKEIVLLINSLGRGGAEGVFVTLANRLFEKNWQITLLVLHLEGAVRQNELNPAIHCTVFNKKHARSSLFVLSRWLLVNKPEKILVFSHQLAVLLVMLRFLLRKNIRIISRNVNTLSVKKKNELSFWHKHVVHKLVSLFYRHVDLIIAQSNGMKDDLISNYGICSSNITIINNPVQKQIENYLSNNIVLSKPNGNYILCIGRLEYQKAFHYAIEAFNKISLHYPMLRLKILGTGRQEAMLKQLVSDLNIADKVDFEGHQQDIVHYYFNASLTMLTSLYEGFPNVLIESIALGTPVVSFDCPSGPNEIIQEGVNGFLVRYQDADHLTECLELALNRQWDPGLIIQTADKFSSSKILDEYEKVLA